MAPLLAVVLATAEGLWLKRTRGSYDWRAYRCSVGDLLLRIGVGLMTLGPAAEMLKALWRQPLYTMPLHAAWAWVLLMPGSDFCYYRMHRADHRVRFLWATHCVHHSPLS